MSNQTPFPRDVNYVTRTKAPSVSMPPKYSFSGYKVTLEARGLTKAHAIAQAVRVLALMMEEAHTKGHTCGTTSGNASAKLDVIP